MTARRTETSFDRKPINHYVVAVLRYTPSRTYILEDQIDSGIVSSIFEISSPIIAYCQTTEKIITYSGDHGPVRVYPPFRLNKKAALTHTFAQVWIPEGRDNVEVFRPLPPHAAKGLVGEHTYSSTLGASKSFYSYGLRVDHPKGERCSEVLQNVLLFIRERTYQWWLTTGSNPFDLGDRFRIDVAYQKELALEPILTSSGEVHSSWAPSYSQHKLIGFEQPLDNDSWRSVEHDLNSGRLPETALNYFYSSVVHYMAGRNDMCILNMALAFEILENKLRRLRGKKAGVNATRAIMSSSHLTDDEKEMMEKLAVDRGHVAHGRIPPNISRKQPTAEHYLKCMSNYVTKALSGLTADEWLKMTSYAYIKRSKGQ